MKKIPTHVVNVFSCFALASIAFAAGVIHERKHTLPNQPYEIIVTTLTPELMHACQTDDNCMDITTFEDDPIVKACASAPANPSAECCKLNPNYCAIIEIAKKEGTL